MPSQSIKYAIPITSKNNYIAREAKNTVKDLKNFLKGEASRTLKSDLEATTQNWKEKPTMVAEYSEPYGVDMQVYAHPKGNMLLNWQRISQGTGGNSGRTIVSSKGMMVFQRDYTPKTTPGGSYGGPGTKSGDTIRARVVGTKKPHRIEPREFSKKIKEKREDEFVRKLDAIVKKAWRT